MTHEPPKHRREEPETAFATILIVAVALVVAALVVIAGFVAVGLSV